MSWLVALLAFAGVMAVLSTIVGVAAEYLRKLSALQCSGLETMRASGLPDVLAAIGPFALVTENWDGAA